ncbi:chemotaxis protein CheX [Sutcliffiella cohnii]
MSLDLSIQHVITGAIESVKAIIPVSISYAEPKLYIKETTDISLGVLITLIGDIHAKLIIQGESSVFQKLAGMLFGMEVEGEMLLSFTGELANMIVGNLTMQISEIGFKTDITPPNVLSEQKAYYLHSETVITSIYVQDHGKMDILIGLKTS